MRMMRMVETTRHNNLNPKNQHQVDQYSYSLYHHFYHERRTVSNQHSLRWPSPEDEHSYDTTSILLMIMMMKMGLSLYCASVRSAEVGLGLEAEMTMDRVQNHYPPHRHQNDNLVLFQVSLHRLMTI